MLRESGMNHFVILHGAMGGADELLAVVLPFFLLVAAWVVVSGAGKREDAQAEERDQRASPG
jgi:hypothetical protein